MNEPGGDTAIVQPVVESALKGKAVITADDEIIGTVDAETDTHLRVRSDAGDAPGGQLWLAKSMVARVDEDAVRLSRDRADLHDAVLAMPPGQQREFASLSLTTRIGRRRGLGHAGR